MGSAGLRERMRAAHARSAPALVLDGALGTELEARGFPTPLPLWSARALLERPALVAEIHREHAAAGAELLTANSFRTQRRSLRLGGAGERAAELTALAVSLAREAAREAPRPPFVLGSAAPLEDCYRPDLVPDDAALSREHAEHAEHLAAAGADAILVETMNCLREAAAAARAASATGLPVLVSFVCDEHARLLSGEPLGAALDAVAAAAPLAVAVNCLPPAAAEACLATLAASQLPFGVYPNLGAPDPERPFAFAADCAPADLGARAMEWLAAGASFIGGCCGTRPPHVRALAEAARR